MSRQLVKKFTAALANHPNVVLRGAFSAPDDKVAIVENTQQQLDDELAYTPSGSRAEDASLLFGADGSGKVEYTFGQLKQDSIVLALKMAAQVPISTASSGATAATSELRSEDGSLNAAILEEPNYRFVCALFATWLCGMMAVPTCNGHHLTTELAHVLRDSRSHGVWYSDTTLRKLMRKAKLPESDSNTSIGGSTSESKSNSDLALVRTAFKDTGDHIGAVVELQSALEAQTPISVEDEALLHVALSAKESSDALMVYTSGTTAKPKGVVHTNSTLSNQVHVLREAWRWTPDDVALNILPLHHVHGLVNILFCALASAATCVMAGYSAFHASWVARRLAHGDLTLFMAVPAVYSKLIQDATTSKKGELPTSKVDGERARRLQVMQRGIRLMVSGSAALPIPFIDQWRAISGHTLLERYGMTEVGMALSQPYFPVEARKPGTVGVALPTVRTKVVPQGQEAGAAEDGSADTHGYDSVGSLLLASPSVFDRYWRNPKATESEFTIEEGPPFTRWFHTGDTVGVRSEEGGNGDVFTILGRTSVDIIKHKGYKISALEIESSLLEPPTPIAEAAVFGVPDETVGEKIVAVVVPKAAAEVERADQRTVRGDGGGAFVGEQSATDNARRFLTITKKLASERMSTYKVPSEYVVLPDAIPRNAMGKINKKDLRKQLFP